MLSKQRLVLVCVVAGTLTACQFGPRQPKMSNAGIAPAVLKPGDTGIMSVEVADRYGIVDRVEATVVGEPDIIFKLNDDGVAPDAKAGDGIWTLDVTVPFTAPPGPFELEVRGYDSSGELILVKSKQGDAMPLSDRFNVEVRYPDQG